MNFVFFPFCFCASLCDFGIKMQSNWLSWCALPVLLKRCSSRVNASLVPPPASPSTSHGFQVLVLHQYCAHQCHPSVPQRETHCCSEASSSAVLCVRLVPSSSVRCFLFFGRLAADPFPRRVKCDLKDVLAHSGQPPVCSNCAERGFNCVGSVLSCPDMV